MSRLYADEDLDHAVVRELRRLGHDVLTVQEAGRAGGPDGGVLGFAVTEGRTAVTFDRWGFVRLHKEVSRHCGIITCTRDPDAAGLAARIHAAVVGRAVMDGVLIRITRPPSRRQRI